MIGAGTADGIDFYNPVYCGRSCVNPTPWIDWVVQQKALGIYAQVGTTSMEARMAAIPSFLIL
mgnify:CR=1 FL=1